MTAPLDDVEEGSSSHSVSFVQLEKEVLAFWEKEQIFQKSLEQSKDKPPYIFYDGPPFATGLPHHGHLVGSTLKDTVPRYFTMRGKYVQRRFGWDCHGLPVEYEIDKWLGMSAHDAVKKLGVATYNDHCRSIVQKYVKEWKTTITRLGRWVDFDHDYKTMDLSFMESVWWVFGQLWEKNLIYKNTKVMPFSTALGTPLSNFEASSNYQDIQDLTATVLFKIVGSDTHLAAWTTTPWTLPSNLGLCVHPDLDYALVEEEKSGKKFYLSQARFEASYSKKFSLTLLKLSKGSELLGLEYEPIFPYFSQMKELGGFRVQGDSYVTDTDGTGIVHLAPAFGEDDHRILKAVNPELIVCPIDNAGKFTNKVEDFSGVYLKDAEKDLLRYLKEKGSLFEQSTLQHSYPFCPRSQTPLIYKAIPSWFVAVEKIKDDILAANEHIHWVPEHLQQGRFGQWLEGARDWAISRNRVWGTPLPIWYNSTADKYHCITKREELEELAGVKLTDLHREFVDDLTFKKPSEEGVYRRIPEVLDCWFESGSMPYAQLHYPFENQELFKEGFPAEFIAEGLDQTRGWFYTLTVLAAALFKKPAFKNVIVNGLVLAKDGKKMSKSLKNYTPPDALMEEFGADSLRLFLLNSALVKAEDLRFSDEGPKEMVRRVLLPWYNSFKFFSTYAEADQWKPSKAKETSEHILDRWILSRLNSLVAKVNKEMEAYHLYNVVPELFTFIDDLTNWYIRLNRRRFWTEENTKDKSAAYETLYNVLEKLCLIMAPFTPFLSEHLYKELSALNLDKNAPISVHLCSYPEAENKTEKNLEHATACMQQLVLMGRQSRNQAKIKVKIPLPGLIIIHEDSVLLSQMKELEETIKTELNVKTITYSSAESDYIDFFLKPNFPVLGKKVGPQLKKITEQLAALSVQEIKQLEKTNTLTLSGFELTLNDVLIQRKAKSTINVSTHPLISMILDTAVTDALIQEGVAREIVSRIQKQRKELALHVADRIHLTITATGETYLAALNHGTYLQAETLASSLEVVEGTPNGEDMFIEIKKV